MSLRAVWWFCFGLSLIPLAVSVTEYVRFRRRGESLPQMSRGAAAMAIGFVLLVSSQLPPTGSAWRWAALLGALACQVLGVVLMRRARRELPGDAQGS